MVKLAINKNNPVKIAKQGRRGIYSDSQKQELLSIPATANLTLELKALASKWGRDYLKVRSQYYYLKELIKKNTESNITSAIPKRTVEEVSKNNSVVNAWSEFETNLLIESMESSENKKATSVELSELIDRTPIAIMARWRYVQDKGIKISHTEQHYVESPTQLDTSFIGESSQAIPSFIPETSIPTFIQEEQVKMYRATIADSLHEKPSDAVKANIRAIIDSIPNSLATDEQMHRFFYENQEKINYLLETNPEMLWNN